MKKKFLLGLALTVLFVSGCQKKDYHVNGNRVVCVQDESKTSNHSVLWFYSGHDGKNCPGDVMLLGKPTHIECYGAGSKCYKAVSVNIVTNSNFETIAVTTDTFDLTSEDVFLMPDRSLDYVDENNNRIFLNIPEQLVYRDTTTQQFTFTGLFFSNTAAYNNY